MSYSSKTYKIRPLYRFLFDSLFEVFSSKQSTLTKVLLVKTLGKEKFEEINTYEFNELFVKMISDLYDYLNAHSYGDLTTYVNEHDRIKELYDLYDKTNTSNNLTNISFRISTETINMVNDLKREKLGEVIQLAIGLYLINCQEEIYNLILMILKHKDL